MVQKPLETSRAYRRSSRQLRNGCLNFNRLRRVYGSGHLVFCWLSFVLGLCWDGAEVMWKWILPVVVATILVVIGAGMELETALVQGDGRSYIYWTFTSFSRVNTTNERRHV
jgi:hypothetical protein